MSQLPSTRRTTSLQGSSRLALSVGKGGAAGSTPAPSRHPLKHDWSVSYVHRPPGTKVEYEKEIKRVATFGSIESFLHLYSHLTPPNELQPVTDVLVFLARITTPGTWECMPDGGKFTIRLVHPITPVLFESLLFALIGDQFEDDDRVVGCVLSARQTEDLISVWVEDEGEALRSGALRERILSLLGLSPSAICEYRSNRALLDAAATLSTAPHAAGAPGTISTPGEKTSYPSNRSYQSGNAGDEAIGSGESRQGGYGNGGGTGTGYGQGRYSRSYQQGQGQGQGQAGYRDEGDDVVQAPGAGREDRRYTGRSRGGYGQDRRDGEYGGERRNGWGTGAGAGAAGLGRGRDVREVRE